MEDITWFYFTTVLPFAIPWFIFGFAINYFFADKQDKFNLSENRIDKYNNNPIKNGIRFAVGYIVVATLFVVGMSVGAMV